MSAAYWADKVKWMAFVTITAKMLTETYGMTVYG